MSEPISQFLIFLGLLAFAHLGGARVAGLRGRSPARRSGLSLLVRIDSVLVAGARSASTCWCAAPTATLPWRARAAARPARCCCSPPTPRFHAAFWSRKYLAEHREPALLGAAAAGSGSRRAAGASWPCSLAAHRCGPRARALAGDPRPRCAARPDRGCSCCSPSTPTSCGRSSRPGPAATATTAPRRSTHRGWLLALGFHRLAAHDAQSLVRLGWFVTPLGAGPRPSPGCVLAIRRWRARYLFPLLVAAHLLALLLLQDPRLQRLLLRAAALRARDPARRCSASPRSLLVASGGARPRAARWRPRRLALCAGRALPARHAARSRRYRDWKNAVRFVDDVARRFGPAGRGDLRAAAQHPPALAAALGRARRERAGAGALQPRPRAAPAPGRAWRGRYRNIYFVHTYRTDLCGLFLQHVEDMRLRHLRVGAHLRRAAAAARSRARCTSDLARRAARGAPGAAAARGRHRRLRRLPGLGLLRQGGRRRPHVPLDGPLRVRLPARGARPATTLVLTAADRAAAGHGAGAGVRLDRRARPWAASRPAATGSEHRLRLPDPLPPGPPVLRLDVPDLPARERVAAAPPTRATSA